MDTGATDGNTPAEFECPVCKDVFVEPVCLPCQHVFCHCCLTESLKVKKHCPACRNPNIGQMTPATDVIKQMEGRRGTCMECRSVVPFSQMRSHLTSHVSAVNTQNIHDFRLSVMTFQCPYCQETGLDDLDLLNHCNENHGFDNRSVVCPICASMPHGDPSYQSRNFIGHLNLRHGFYIEDYVDTTQNDAINEQGAILASYNALLQ
ncbi:E3 ubiquitin-protein ligase RNF114-like [Huso huso]|uniref:E3 ubiquitin-protein ligase RNF166 n=1 Tax=Huso huso TaxID=61971 RepID=A0ABR1A5M3_HUSHU